MGSVLRKSMAKLEPLSALGFTRFQLCIVSTDSPTLVANNP